MSQFILEPSTDVMAAAASHLVAGGLVAFPTETVYGLGADACNAMGVARIYEVKGRPADHPLIVHVASMAGLGEWGLGRAVLGDSCHNREGMDQG